MRIKSLLIVLATLLIISVVFIINLLRNTLPAWAKCQNCNVILITMTNLRYKQMSQNGYFRPTTPNLDKFAKKSLVFDQAFTHASWTLPEAISIYTSLYPFQHGVMERFNGSTLVKKTITLIDLLNMGGYKTAAFTGGFDYNPEFGLTKRFGHYEECIGEKLPNYPRQVGPKVIGAGKYGSLTCTIPKALEWLKNNYSKKFFLHVQGFDTHCPFSQNGGKIFDKDYKRNIDFSNCLWTLNKTKPEILNGKEYYRVNFSNSQGLLKEVLLSQEDIKHLIALYDESIVSADSQIGSFLDGVEKLGLMKNTIVIFTSEHGDIIGKNGLFTRAGPARGIFDDDVLHIPLLIKHPKISTKKISGLVSQIDLMPTMLDLLGIKEKPKMSGKSLIPLIFKGKDVHEYIFAGSEFVPYKVNPFFNKKTRLEAIRNKKWKLISEVILDQASVSENIELYNMQNDNNELYNLSKSNKIIVSQLKSILDDWYIKSIK